MQICAGLRTHELRRNDRNFDIGDQMNLCEYDPESKNYTGQAVLVEITSITSSVEPCAVSSEALHNDFCILSIKKI
jgi:hypothetical protein